MRDVGEKGILNVEVINQQKNITESLLRKHERKKESYRDTLTLRSGH